MSIYMAMERATLRDCYSNEYSIVHMPGTGLCGYHSIAYCLIGNQFSHSQIIQDCMNVFMNIPELFRLRTNFGALCDSSLTLTDYASFMENAVRQVDAGRPVDTLAWAEDAHFAAIALLYDIMVCVYSVENRQWYVFNECGTGGYICLLNSRGHFDVLTGVSGMPPVLPVGAHSQCVNRDDFPSSYDVWLSLQGSYSFKFVFKLPEEFSGISILNRPLVSSDATMNATALASETDAAQQTDKVLYKCDFGGCGYITENVNSLQMHKLRCHRKKRKSLTTGTPSTPVLKQTHGSEPNANYSANVNLCLRPQRNKQSMYYCDIAGCTYSSSKFNSITKHKMKVHSQSSKSFDTSAKIKTIADRHKNLLVCPKTTEMDIEAVTPSSHGSFASRELESDVTSVKSWGSTTSRRSERIAERPVVSYVESLRPSSVQNRSGYVCDVNDCSAVYKTRRGLSVHKDKRHSSDILTDVTTVESDNVSLSRPTDQKSPLRRSSRICCLNRTSTAQESISEMHKIKSSNMHRFMAPAPSVEENMESAETVMKSVSASTTNTNICCKKAILSRRKKQHVKEMFSDKIAKLEKDFLPKEKVNKQNDPLYDKLKNYHDNLLKSVTNTTTEKLSAEVLDVIKNPAVIDDCDRKFLWSKDDEKRLNELNKTCKLLQPRSDWTWAASDDSEQGQYNDKRMQLCVTHECQWKIIECENCQSTGLLVGDQIDSSVCHDCAKLINLNEKAREHKEKAWEKVRPKSQQYPKAADGQDLPYLQPGEKAVISLVHPVVTVKKNYYADRKLRQESISLLQHPIPTLCKVLPRTSLADRFIVIERRVRDTVKHIVANKDRVRQWIRYLFLNHKDFIRLQRQNQLTIDENAIDALGPDLELAEVDSGLAEHTASEAEQLEEQMVREDEGLNDATATSGFSETHVYSFDRYPELYLKSKDVLRVRKEGKVEIVKDDTVRKPTYSASANLCFPHLYPHAEMSPLDFQDNKLARYLLKKQALYAHRMGDGRLQWTFAEDDIHMAHQYSRLSEQTVRANVGYYLSSHPSVAHVPLNNIITAFREGVDKDSGLLDSHLPDLTTVMSQLPNSRQKWFSERLAIEAISRDLGSPNVFVTINPDPRASPDVRRLIYQLEHGKEMHRDEPFVKDTAEFTRLINKYAPQVAIYLYRKMKIMMHVFFTKICGIPEREPNDWEQQDLTETGWYWGRCEWTNLRGVVHMHFLARLKGLLETELLGRIIHNGRVVRQELKCGNINPEKREKAFQIIEMGLLASRYVALFADSISTASFYSEEVDTDGHQDDKVIRLEDYRKEYAKNYKEGNINLKTHPIMRRFDDPECNENQFHEMAQVASVSCLHQCIKASCGGDPLSGDGCRFDFPKKQLKHTVAAVMQVNAQQMEARVLLRRTCDRVANLNRYLIRYLRSNHDVSVLIDSAHKLRYATKYCAKSGKHNELLDEMIEHLNKRSRDLLPPNMKQVLSHLLLADCSHRAFITKQELAYKVMDLPEILKSFADVDIVGFYSRANLQVPYDDHYTIEYSDRTEYSAYAERCREDTELGRGLTKEAVENMSLNEFAQTIRHHWVKVNNAESSVIDPTTKRKFRTRDVSSGHWRLTLCIRRKHIRPSTVLHTAPAIDYEFVEHGKTTTQTTFFDLPAEKRNQLYRAYYELVMYVPWKNTPDETFLSARVRAILNDKETHAEVDSRHSLQRLEEFYKIYQKLYNDGRVAPRGSAWQRDNQFSYSRFLEHQHNRDMHLDRVDNRGMLKAQYEDVDELQNVDVDIRATVNDVADESEYPTFQNFMPPEIYRDIVEQKPMELSEICVAFPLQHQWQHLEEVVTHDKAKRFIAKPPRSPLDYEDMTPIQKFAVDVGKDETQQILFLCGKAGSGKTAVALKICEHFLDRVQATAYTGKAASIFNGPTIHSMFGWSHKEHTSVSTAINPDSKKVQEFSVAHEGIDLFVIEEALAIPPAYFSLMDEFMTAAFNPKHNRNSLGEVPPYGGKKMLFLGDQAQLPPIGGPAVYGEGRTTENTETKRRESKQAKRTKAGQLIFDKYLVPNCIYLQRGQRNCGLLGEICDRMRQGELTEDDFTMLTYQRTRFPDVCTDYGIHYQNEMCSMHNWRQLWKECSLSTPSRRMFICKATYHVTSDNQHIVDALSTLPPQSYDYAPDILCVAEGCEVRLLHNMNIAAGLVTSQSGTVVKVVYNNADVNLLLAGEHVVPYCIVVSFAAFQGFVQKADLTGKRIFPFPNQRTWVPIFRRRFAVNIRSLPTWIRKKQLEKDCFRIQFPIDLASNITAHRAQGQTMSDCLVSVDLGLDNPDMKIPPEIGSLLYVACTRVTKLENLFVSAIHPCLWQKIGQTDVDKHRRTIDTKLRQAAGNFAVNHGMYQEMRDELSWTPDYGNNAAEWRLLQQQTDAPQSRRHMSATGETTTISDTDFNVDLVDIQFTMFCAPVLSERHIGIDQGTNNFAIAVVERTVGEYPNIVQAKNYTDLELKNRFKASDVLVALTQKTDLLSWMEPVNKDHRVDRVVVHLEQIDPRNRNSKQFSVELGKLLQQQVSDSSTCVVKMSQPHIHRATGPLFHLGDDIVETLQLQPSLYLQRRSRAESNPSVVSDQDADIESEPSDVEPSDDTALSSRTRKSDSHEYRAKKRMSSEVFRYIIESDEERLQQMKLSVEKNVRDYWRQKFILQPSVKLDDVGDALLHALDELLCGSTNFKQLVPAAPSVHVNRTVVVAVFPQNTYWIVLNCRWNTFVLENFGCLRSGLCGCYYKHPSTVDIIKTNMIQSVDVWSSLSEFDGNTTYEAVDHVKVVVKQLTGHTDLGMKNEEAGALTDSTTKAMKLICDHVIGINSKLFERRDRVLGSMYSRTSTVHRNRKFQVVNSTGKHTNAVLSCLSWMQHNLRDYVENRREILTEHEKRTFFHAMMEVARSDANSIEMLQLSPTVKTKLCSDEFAVLMRNDCTYTRNIADLVLVGISKNQQHVKAVAANSRKTTRTTKPVSSNSVQ